MIDNKEPCKPRYESRSDPGLFQKFQDPWKRPLKRSVAMGLDEITRQSPPLLRDRRLAPQTLLVANSNLHFSSRDQPHKLRNANTALNCVRILFYLSYLETAVK